MEGGLVKGTASDTEGVQIFKGIIVVEIQYRLGAFGWLSLPKLTEEGLVDFNGNPVLDDNGNPVKTSGNYAILDCIKGLQWVHDYIQVCWYN